MIWIIRYSGYLMGAEMSSILLTNTNDIFFLAPALLCLGMMLYCIVKYTQEEEVTIAHERIN